MKKFMCLFLVCTFIFVLGGCGNEVPEYTEDISIITLARPKNMLGLEDIIYKFEAEHTDIQVKIVDMPEEEEERHGTCVSALSGGDSSVDIYMISEGWIDEFADREYLLPVDQYFLMNKEIYMKQAIDMFKSRRDRLYALPFSFNMDCLYYRKDIIKEIPATWEDVFRLIKANQSETIYGIDIPNEVGSEMIYTIKEMETAFDGDLERVLSTYKNILDFNYQKKNIQNPFIYTFKDGKALFLYADSSFWSNLNDDASAVKGKVGVVPVPEATNGGKKSGLLGGYGLGINRRSKHVPQAVAFLQFVDQYANRKAVSQIYGYFPVMQTLYEDESVLIFNPHFRNFPGLIDNLKLREEMGGYVYEMSHTMQVLDQFFNDKESLQNTLQQLQKF